MDNVRCIVMHRPGPGWLPGVDFREQPSVMAHVLHYRKLFEEGKLEIGGPFLAPDKGGMMIPTPDMGRDALEQFAAADPAVQSGLLVAEVIEWYTPMKKST